MFFSPAILVCSCSVIYTLFMSFCFYFKLTLFCLWILYFYISLKVFLRFKIIDTLFWMYCGLFLWWISSDFPHLLFKSIWTFLLFLKFSSTFQCFKLCFLQSSSMNSFKLLSFIWFFHHGFTFKFSSATISILLYFINGFTL